jgi:hypothetical protein
MAIKKGKKRKQVSMKSEKLSGHPYFLDAINWAMDSYKNGESQVQSRLNNFLLAASILFLAWATIYVAPASRTRVPVLITLSILGAFFSLFWWLLALRERNFFKIIMDIILYLESYIEAKEFRIWTLSSQLQQGNSVKLHTEDKMIKHGFKEMIITSRSVVVLTPAVFGIAFLILVVVSIIEIFH